jgi:hypothetical protein
MAREHCCLLLLLLVKKKSQKARHRRCSLSWLVRFGRSKSHSTWAVACNLQAQCGCDCGGGRIRPNKNIEYVWLLRAVAVGESWVVFFSKGELADPQANVARLQHNRYMYHTPQPMCDCMQNPANRAPSITRFIMPILLQTLRLLRSFSVVRRKGLVYRPDQRVRFGY